MKLESLNIKDYTNWVYFFFGFFVLFSLLFSYIKAEILTTTTASEFDIPEICNNFENLKFYKITDFQSVRGVAEIQCIYKESSNNQEVKMNRSNNKWKVVFREKLNRERKIYWPIYL
jgi:TusA-related sulfurtransferase